MTREEATHNLGTIAHSGTLEYLERMSVEGRKPDMSLIGQFGVGFYSAFMVASEVHVDSHSARSDNDPVRWSSRGDGSFEVAAGTRGPRGSRIELMLEDDAKEFPSIFASKGSCVATATT